MKVTINNEQTKNKDLTIEDNLWIGKRVVKFDGQIAQKIDRRTYKIKFDNNDEIIKLSGNHLFGVKCEIFNNNFEIYKRLFWYELLIYYVTLCTGLIFACLGGFQNNGVWLSSLCGGICGGISGVLSTINYMIFRYYKKLSIKLTLSIQLAVITILLCYIVVYLIF